MTSVAASGWRRARVIDVALAGLISVTSILLYVRSDPALAALMGVLPLPLSWRRTHPLPSALASAVLLGSVVSIAPLEIAHPIVLMVVSLVSTYSVAAYEPRLAYSAAGGALVTVGMTADIILYGPGGTDDAVWPFRIVEGAIAWLVGRAMYRRGRQLHHLDLRAQQLAADQQRRAEVAVIEERARLARELHDVVAHNVSLMVVQAGAAEQVLADDPPRALEPMRNVQDIGRQTVDELRRLLGILRDQDDAEASRAPQPTLADLDALLDRVRGTGTRVTVEREGDLEVPASIDLSAYRILQEGLTNVVKHADAANVHVVIRREREVLVLEVADDGRGRNGRTSGGLGLVGMAERVALLGGVLETSDRTGGGFRLHARLPLASAPP